MKYLCWSCGKIHHGREVIWKVWDSRKISKETKWSLSALTTASFWIFWRYSLETLTDAAKCNNACLEIVIAHSINFSWEANVCIFVSIPTLEPRSEPVLLQLGYGWCYLIFGTFSRHFIYLMLALKTEVYIITWRTFSLLFSTEIVHVYFSLVIRLKWNKIPFYIINIWIALLFKFLRQ